MTQFLRDLWEQSWERLVTLKRERNGFRRFPFPRTKNRFKNRSREDDIASYVKDVRSVVFIATLQIFYIQKDLYCNFSS